MSKKQVVNEWAEVLESPILKIHPDRDKPAKTLLVRRKHRDRLALISAGLNLFGSIMFSVFLHANGMSLKTSGMFAFGIGIFMAILMLPLGMFSVQGGNKADYSEIKETLDAAEAVLFPSSTPGVIYTLPVEVVSNSSNRLLHEKAITFLYYEKCIQEQVSLAKKYAPSAVAPDIRRAINLLIVEKRQEFKTVHATLRAVGLGEEKWDSYFSHNT